METNGFLPRKAYLTKKKAITNADSNATQAILGKMTLASTRRQQTAPENQQIQLGIPLQA
jgi:hypothetical protein